MVDGGSWVEVGCLTVGVLKFVEKTSFREKLRNSSIFFPIALLLLPKILLDFFEKRTKFESIFFADSFEKLFSPIFSFLWGLYGA